MDLNIKDHKNHLYCTLVYPVFDDRDDKLLSYFQDLHKTCGPKFIWDL